MSPVYMDRKSSTARNTDLDAASFCRSGFSAMTSPQTNLFNEAGSNNIRQLQGPILILGASGFIGANLLRTLMEDREDVYGTATRLPAWRLEGLPREHVLVTDLLIDSNLDAMLEAVKPRTIFDCIAYGAYSFETDRELIYRTNFNLISRLLCRLNPAEIFPVMCMPAVPRNTETTPPDHQRTRCPHRTATTRSQKWLLPA